MRNEPEEQNCDCVPCLLAVICFVALVTTLFLEI
jgi:hypothetical protein